MDNKQTHDQVTIQQLQLQIKQLSDALGDVIDGDDCYDLANKTGFDSDYCQTNIINVWYKSKNS